MSDVEAVAKILAAELDAGHAHARIVAAMIVDRLFGEGADSEDAPIEQFEAREGFCAACGQAAPEFGGIIADDARGEIRFGGKRVGSLTGREYALFRLLLNAKGRTLSKELIIGELYAKEYRADDEMPEMKIIDVFICKLRKKITGLGLDVGTTWGRGYYLVDPNRKETAA